MLMRLSGPFAREQRCACYRETLGFYSSRKRPSEPQATQCAGRSLDSTSAWPVTDPLAPAREAASYLAGEAVLLL